MNGTPENQMSEDAPRVKATIGTDPKKKKLTLKRLKEQLMYDEKTGHFFWRVAKHKTRIGQLAGSNAGDGYLQIGIDGANYLAHRLVWFYVYNYFPEQDIDHINRNGRDNRLSNLREVSRSCNIRNSANRKNNTSGVRGVSWHKNRRKWYVRISTINKDLYLGSFDSFDDAVCARLMGEQCLRWSGCDSNSSAYQYVQKNIIKPLKESKK